MLGTSHTYLIDFQDLRFHLQVQTEIKNPGALQTHIYSPPELNVDSPNTEKLLIWGGVILQICL